MLALKGKLKFEFEGCGMPNSLAKIENSTVIYTHNEQHKGDQVVSSHCF